MRTFITLLLFFWGIQASFSQKVYVDYKPQYTEWVRNYIVDKIEYTKENTIFYFRYIGSRDYDAMDFRGLTNIDRWCLENVENPDETFYLTDIRNIRVESELKMETIGSKDIFYHSPQVGQSVTCEVYFPRLPKHIKKVHFLEGKQAKGRTNHFHALDVSLKTFDDPNLGTEYDRTERINQLKERIVTNYNSTKRYSIYYTPPQNNQNLKQSNTITTECKARM
jgi:ribosomal 30S subunit maturation factor RimM